MITYEYKLKTTKKQERLLGQSLFQSVGVYNWTVKQIENVLVEEAGWCPLKLMKPLAQRSYLSAKIKGHSATCGLQSRVINSTIEQAIDAAKRHTQGLSGKPKLKSVRNKKKSFVFKGDVSITDRHIVLPKIGHVRFCKMDIPDGVLRTARPILRNNGWHVSCVFDAQPKAVEVISSNEIGIDPGLSTAITTSSGEKFENPRFYETAEKLIGQAQRGGNKKLAARRHRKLANRRRDWQHKLSRKLVSENKTIVWSDDSFKNMAKLHGKQVNSLANGQLAQMLEYKVNCRTDGLGKFIRVASRNSTKTCSSCGALSGPTGLHGLSVRNWVCCACGAQHDRDINAAINTLISGRGTPSNVLVKVRQKSYKTRSGFDAAIAAQSNPVQ